MSERQQAVNEYHQIQHELEQLIRSSGATLDELVDHHYRFPEPLIRSMTHLLYRKKNILRILGQHQIKDLTLHSLVDLTTYRKLKSKT